MVSLREAKVPTGIDLWMKQTHKLPHPQGMKFSYANKNCEDRKSAWIIIISCYIIKIVAQHLKMTTSELHSLTQK